MLNVEGHNVERDEKINKMPFRCIRPTAEIFYGLCVFTYGFNLVSLPQILQHRVCYNKYNASICKHLNRYPSIENDVQANAADWMSILPLSALLPSLFTILIIGPLSDIKGKQRIMIIPPVVYLIQGLVYTFLSQLQSEFSPGLFILPYCLSGLFGDNYGCSALSEAYISSITTKKDRTIGLSVLESALFFGQLTAALSSSFILSKLGFTGGFVLTTTISFINLLYVLFLLPSEKYFQSVEECSGDLETTKVQYESTVAGEKQDDDEEYEESGTKIIPTEPRIENVSTMEALNPITCLLRIKNAICTGKRRNIIAAILLLFSIASFVNMGELYIGILYIKHSPFNLNSVSIGYLIAAQGFIRGVGLVSVPCICQRFLKFKDIHVIFLGFCTQIVYFVSVGFADSVTSLYLIQMIGISLAVHFPVFRSMITKLVDDDQYGSAISAVEVVGTGSALVTGLLSNQIYSATVDVHRGMTCILLGIVAVPGLIGSLIFWFVWKGDEHHEEKENLLGNDQSETSH